MGPVCERERERDGACDLCLCVCVRARACVGVVVLCLVSGTGIIITTITTKMAEAEAEAHWLLAHCASSFSCPCTTMGLTFNTTARITITMEAPVRVEDRWLIGV